MRPARFAGTVEVLHEEKPATLLLDREPSRQGHGFIRYEDGEQVEVAALGDVRRAKLYYMRDRHGKAARIREKR
mgnify:CR=1 FL=1